MDLSFFAELSKPMGALAGAVILALVAVAAGSVMLVMLVVLRRSEFMRNTEVAQTIFSRVSPPVFYFGIVAPVWAIFGGMAGYQFAGNP